MLFTVHTYSMMTTYCYALQINNNKRLVRRQAGTLVEKCDIGRGQRMSEDVQDPHFKALRAFEV